MNIEKQNELVLVIDEPMMMGFEGLHKTYPKELGAHGVTKQTQDAMWLKHCLRQSYFLPRSLVEHDAYYKQLIPYVIFKRGDKIFSYSREGTESRLTGKISIGIGGHINPEDIIAGMSNVIERAAEREISEELDLSDLSICEKTHLQNKLYNVRGIIYAGGDNDEVNSVHLGVLYIVDFVGVFENAEITLTDEGKQLAWMTKEELLEKSDDLELWSKMVLDECL